MAHNEAEDVRPIVATALFAAVLEILPAALLVAGFYTASVVFPASWGWFGRAAIIDHWPHTIEPTITGVAPVVAVTTIAVVLARLLKRRHVGAITITALIFSSLIYCWTLYYLASISTDAIGRSYAGFWLWVYLPLGLTILLPSFFVAYRLFRRVWPAHTHT